MNRGRRQVVTTLALAALGARPALAQQKLARIILFARSPPPDLAAERRKR